VNDAPSASFAAEFLSETAELARSLPTDVIDRMAAAIAGVRDRGGRLFILGIGGGAGHASHAVNDFRKLCHVESYAPTDNVSELTARTNDEGWDTTFVQWLQISRFARDDAILVFSVGGGSLDPPISANIARAVQFAAEAGGKVFGIVGRSEGVTAQLATECVVIPAPAAHLTPLVEAFQAVVWHLLVSHPKLAAQAGKWESTLGSPSGT
jgi:D-sedoheptulose 7-phosphate isomerase